MASVGEKQEAQPCCCGHQLSESLVWFVCRARVFIDITMGCGWANFNAMGL